MGMYLVCHRQLSNSWDLCILSRNSRCEVWGSGGRWFNVNIVFLAAKIHKLLIQSEVMVILNRRLSKESFWKDGRTPTIWSYELENAKKSLDYRGNVFCTSSTSPHVNSTLFHLSHNQQPSGLDRSINTPHLIQDANSQQLTVFRPWNQGLRRCLGKPTTITQLEGVHTFLSSKDTNSMPARPLSPPHSPHVPKNDNNPASSPISIM